MHTTGKHSPHVGTARSGQVKRSARREYGERERALVRAAVVAFIVCVTVRGGDPRRAVEERGARKLCEEPAAQRGKKRTLHYARFLLLLRRLHLLLDVAFAEIHFSLVWFWRGTEKTVVRKRRW